MRGRAIGDSLLKGRAVHCARRGLKLVYDGTPADEELNTLHKAYYTEPGEFVDEMTDMIKSLCDRISDTENPGDAIELTMVSALLADRMTNRALMQAPGMESNSKLSCQRDGILMYNDAETSVIPYKGKD